LVFVAAPLNFVNNNLVEALLDVIVGAACAWGAFRLAFPQKTDGD
jgi:hypothetical protein